MYEQIPPQTEQAIEIALERFEKFKNTSAFADLSSAEQAAAEDVVGYFSGYMASFQNQTLTDWTLEAMETVCLYALPAKVAADATFFRALPRILSAFFEALAKENFLINGNEFSKRILELAAQIEINAANENLWGFGKTFAMSAIEAGVDLNDEAQLEAFLGYFNQTMENIIDNTSEDELEKWMQNMTDEERAQMETFYSVNRDELGDTSEAIIKNDR